MKILITGSSNGLGAALAQQLLREGHTVYGFDIADGNDVCDPYFSAVPRLSLNDTDAPPHNIRLAAPPEKLTELDVLINNAGINIINWLEDFTEKNWDAVMDVNAKGIYMMARFCLPMLVESKGTILNVVSNAAHMPMTCSLAYNASKGAAHIMTLQLARELTRKYGITVFGVAPNKLRGTGMSDSIDDQVVATRGWTKEHAQSYQLAGLLAGEETPPERVAEFVAYLLRSKDNHKYLTGCILPYGA